MVLTAVLFSTGGAAIKWTTLTSWQAASFRSAAAATMLFVFLPASRRNWTRKTFFAALAYAGTLIFFVLGTKLTTAANTIFLQSTAPLYVLALSPWILKERITSRDLVYMLFVATGLILFFLGEQPASHTAPDPFHGNLLAACSGICWAFTLIGLRWMSRSEGAANASLAIVGLGNLLTFLICLWPALSHLHPATQDYVAIAYLGIFNVGLAYILMAHSMQHIPALEASTILLIEPALNPVWTWLLHGETPGLLPIIGGALILGSTALKMWIGSRLNPKQSVT